MPAAAAPFRITSLLRQAAESLILLAVAVVLFRGFAAEGFMISTGSMAPTLLGYHRRVICPECHYRFARGAATEDDHPAGAIASTGPQSTPRDLEQTCCPNCGLSDIMTQAIPRNEGDQLLVRKLAYEFRDPHRWEVIVFRNPEDPQQAYVKRVVGLPGERIEVRHGEIWANGQQCRKPYLVQKAMRIPVSDLHNQPQDTDPDWRSRWQPAVTRSGWSFFDGRVRYSRGHESSPNEAPIAGSPDWLEYRHWIRAGGTHLTSVALPDWPSELQVPDPAVSNVTYEAGMLTCRGVLTDFERQRWLAGSDQPRFAAAIEALFEKSHVAPIYDEYGYNASGDLELYPLKDFMVSLRIQDLTGAGDLQLELNDGRCAFRVVLQPSSRTLELWSDVSAVPLQRVELAGTSPADELQIDFSLIDHQVLCAINGSEVFTPLAYEAHEAPLPVQRPVRIGARNVTFELSELVLYRDVYYTPKQNDRAELQGDEFFVLGDNSPVSVDSRCWKVPGIPRSSLIGKPLFVHLPSRQGEISWGGSVRHVRLPDFSRVRVIR
ncbi:signal peptidase I [Planctomicrobium sp. SH664]|uniref:signal peptidase I n=1 Tax=Planctomicrobium sp. SH664 TaxID=3448125 RepID=UPI003F5B5645